MATILTKTFDTAHGAVYLSIQDAVLGNITQHTVYVLQPDGTPNDVAAEIANIGVMVDTWANSVKAAMLSAGWTSGS